MENYTHDEATKKFCPLTKGHCKGVNCMLFVCVGSEVKEIPYKPPRIGSDSVLLNVYVCGLVNKNLITGSDDEEGRDRKKGVR